MIPFEIIEIEVNENLHYVRYESTDEIKELQNEKEKAWRKSLTKGSDS